MMRRLTSAPNPSARLRRYMRISGLSRSSRAAASPAFSNSPRRASSSAVIARLVGAIAVMDAVVAGQVAGGLAGGDHVIDGHGILAVRQRDLLHLGPQRLVHPDRLADRRFDLGVQPRAEMLADQADPQVFQRLAQRLAVGRHGPIDRGAVVRIVPGQDFQQQGDVLDACRPWDRSGPGCWRRPPGRSGSPGRRSASGR